MLTKEQVTNLMGMVATTDTDELDCDGCLGEIAEFADLHLSTKDIPEAMQVVQRHMEQCLCCKDEFSALLKALQEIEAN